MAASKKASDRSLSYDQKGPMTPAEYSGLQAAYDHFNNELWGGALPDVFITYQRHAHSFGYFAHDRFANRIDKHAAHELALNPDGFIGRTDKAICSTLVHEQTHVWQQAHGKPSARGYHNRQWANAMKAIGLQPSSTDMVGGKETGQHMSHYIVDDGAFSHSYDRLAATGWKLALQSAHRPGPKGGKKGKPAFTCPECRQKAWGKPGLKITCTPCGIEMPPDHPGDPNV
jgi:hypothetical protein